MSITVLIVEEDPRVREALARGLNTKGFLTISTSTVEDAEREIEEVDLIVLDAHIGHRSTIEFFNRINKTKPTLVISGKGKPESIPSKNFLDKPFTLEALLGAFTKITTHAPS